MLSRVSPEPIHLSGRFGRSNARRPPHDRVRTVAGAVAIYALRIYAVTIISSILLRQTNYAKSVTQNTHHAYLYSTRYIFDKHLTIGETAPATRDSGREYSIKQNVHQLHSSKRRADHENSKQDEAEGNRHKRSRHHDRPEVIRYDI
jgi:hypothetical protein